MCSVQTVENLPLLGSHHRLFLLIPSSRNRLLRWPLNSSRDVLLRDAYKSNSRLAELNARPAFYLFHNASRIPITLYSFYYYQNTKTVL